MPQEYFCYKCRILLIGDAMKMFGAFVVVVSICCVWDVGQTAYSEIHINTAEELARGLAQNPSGSFVLCEDIKLPHDWASPSFSGVLDGSGYTISGAANELFSYMENAAVRNLVLAAFDITAPTAMQDELSVGILARAAINSTIENITVIGGKVSANAVFTGSGAVGGLLGKGTNLQIFDVRLSNMQIDVGMVRTAGGLAGSLEDSEVENIALSGIEMGSKARTTGGLVGYAQNSNFTECAVELAQVTGIYFAGGFVGYVDKGGIFTNSYSVANVNGAITGGFVAKSHGKSTDKRTPHAIRFENCRAWGNVYASTKMIWELQGREKLYNLAGGFAGISSYTIIMNCISGANTLAKSGDAGGFACWVTDRSQIINTRAKGNVAALRGAAGGFVGKISGSSRIEFSHAAGLVQGCTNVGGFVGVISADGEPNTISESITTSRAVAGRENVRRFAGLLLHDGVNGCHAYLGMVVILDGKLAHVTPGGFGADGADIRDWPQASSYMPVDCRNPWLRAWLCA